MFEQGDGCTPAEHMHVCLCVHVVGIGMLLEVARFRLLPNVRFGVVCCNASRLA